MTHLRRFFIENSCYHTISATRGRRPVLADPLYAELLLASIQFIRDEQKAFVLAYAVMPDHMHLILVPASGGTVSDVMHSIKTWSARQINKRTGHSGPLWQQSFYDRVIRDESQLEATIAYIHENPVKAGLAPDAASYPFSSAFPGRVTDVDAYFSQ